MTTTLMPADTAHVDAKLTEPTLSSTMTVNYNGKCVRGQYSITVGYADFQAAALFKDVTICTLPAKTRLVGIVCDTTVKYAGPAGTLALIVGVGSGGAEYVATHDVKTAAITVGLADADLGTLLVRSGAIAGGTMPSWTATQAVVARITSSSGNTSSFTTGSTTFTLITESYA